MNYIKRFEAIDPPSMNNLFDKPKQITKKDILDIKNAFNELKYILKDEGFGYETSFENTDTPLIFVYKVFKGKLAPHSSGKIIRILYPMLPTDSDELMEFVDRMDGELKYFDIKVQNHSSYMSIDFYKI